ncbi:hypothetical protein TCAL_09471 [Tigriopus californicus]|uniref:F5/8 type C domain-containing protein n=1 Tax=Tigriopus californicus TaxID=6832 RepID=A0A553PKA8_TIGCA|nr:uncharacterized protein LOC131890014 [Tigriopus californicus]TRY78113.1 hypothetical protein TCAL_09471 [Tigriopus californicus]|eukprot:TCALIF_09471-PA protein Name:"Protein of unknown function" AED:0.00 eAED:0.00 QI:114/1/1/1/1/1/3/357/322
MRMNTIWLALIVCCSLCIFEFAHSEPCFQPEILRLGALGAMCHTNSEVRPFPCQKAIDGNPNTLWTPNINRMLSGVPVFFELHLNQHVLVSGLKALQFQWAHGSAKTLRLVFNNDETHVLQIPEDFGRYDNWINLALPHQVKASIIRIDILDVHGMSFGGFAELKFYGCNVQPNLWDAWKPHREGYSAQYRSNQNSKEAMDSGLGEPSVSFALVLGGFCGLVLVLVLFCLCVFFVLREKSSKQLKESDYYSKANSVTQSAPLSVYGKTNEENLYEVIQDIAKSVIVENEPKYGKYGKRESSQRKLEDVLSIISEATEPRSPR